MRGALARSEHQASLWRMHGRFTETEALIVGAGPTGLMAALELASRGIHARIIDKADSLPPKSGALILQSRTLELLQRQGLADEFVAAGRKVRAPSSAVLSHGERKEVDLGDVGAEDSRFPFLLFLREDGCGADPRKEIECAG